jgi:hypothetical protein
VAATEIGRRHGVDDAARRRAELAFEDRFRIGTGDGVHGVEPNPETRGKQTANGAEVEQAFHQRGVVGDRIDAKRCGAGRRKVDILRLHDVVGGDRLGRLENAVGHLFGRGTAIRRVELDAEVLVRTAGIVAGRHDDAAIGLADADKVGGGRCRQDGVPADNDLPGAGRRGHAQDHLRGAVVEVTAIAAKHERFSGDAPDAGPNRLDEILQIVRTHENPRLLAQAGCSRFLVFNRLRFNRQFLHGFLPIGRIAA